VVSVLGHLDEDVVYVGEELGYAGHFYGLREGLFVGSKGEKLPIFMVHGVLIAFA